jgi:transcriptional regulator GlxA family with amidase domain
VTAKDIDPMISDVPRHVGFFVYPGFILLDLSGPLEVFSTANMLVPSSYRFSFMSIEGTTIVSSSGLIVSTVPVSAAGIDTLIVVGDPDLSNGPAPQAALDFLRTASSGARRTASVCMGAFLLAQCGVLDGRVATTHWRWAPSMQEQFPSISVAGDRIYVNDGGIWTSAGMSAGIDLSLALIEEDLGRELARQVARMMVVYYRRPGGQMQYSSLLDLDPGSDRIQAALAFAREHLHEPLSVETLAVAARLSVRQFSRAFASATGMPPAKAVERLRAESARPRVEEGHEALDTIAASVGFGDAERMRKAFIRAFGQSPMALRRAAATHTLAYQPQSPR